MEDIKDIKDLSRQIEEGCRFCNPPEKQRILYKTEHFYVMVSLGPIVEGYLLIVSKEHIGACLHLPLSYWKEFLELKSKVKSILESVYGCCLFYEHGKIGNSLTIGKDHHHCFHSHLHCVPVSIGLNDIVSKDLCGIDFKTLTEAYKFVNENSIERYLLVEDENIKIYFPRSPLRSQYLRYSLAKGLHRESAWDWIACQNWPLIDISIEQLKTHFQ